MLAAIANAIYDATGIRFKELPITPEKVLEALAHSPLPGEIEMGGKRGGKDGAARQISKVLERGR
jgi:hypothetical protein